MQFTAVMSHVTRQSRRKAVESRDSSVMDTATAECHCTIRSPVVFFLSATTIAITKMMKLCFIFVDETETKTKTKTRDENDLSIVRTT